MNLTKTYKSTGLTRTLDVISFEYAETEQAAILHTATEGDIVINAVDNPAMWAQFLEQKDSTDVNDN